MVVVVVVVVVGMLVHKSTFSAYTSQRSTQTSIKKSTDTHSNPLQSVRTLICCRKSLMLRRDGQRVVLAMFWHAGGLCVFLGFLHSLSCLYMSSAHIISIYTHHRHCIVFFSRNKKTTTHVVCLIIWLYLVHLVLT